MAVSAHVSELRQMDDSELEARLAQAKQELFNLRFQVVTGRLDNVARIGQARREVARILTLLRAREIEAAEALESRPNQNEEAAGV
jgi:large subunit ribosomal protein L29